MEHSPYGGSRLWRRHECPGSRREEEGLPDLTTEAAESGRRVHAIAASMINLAMRGTDLAAVVDLPGQADEEVDLARKCCEFFLSRWAIVADHPGAFYVVEERLELPGKELSAGTVDAAIISPPICETFDWKTGKKEFVEEAIGWQVMDYGQLLMEKNNLEATQSWVYNPRTGQQDYCDFGVGDGARQMIDSTVDAGEQPNAPLHSGDWCDHCRALGICEETVGKAKQLVQLVDVEPQKDDTATKRAVAKELDAMPAEKLLQLLELAAIVKPAYEAVIARAREVLSDHPDALPGWRLSTRGGKRSIKIGDAYAAMEPLLDTEEFWGCCDASVRRMELAVEAKLKGSGAKRGAWRKAFQAATDGLIKQQRISELRRVKRET